jgi:osmotically-inducible protein OsmY
MKRFLILVFGAAAAAAAVRFINRDRLNRVKGAVATATPRMPGTHKIDDVDDVTLARKVETEIFRAPDAPKGDVSVDVQAGVANLRGVVADETWITKLADDAKKVDGIKGVNNLLHAPGTPAPSPEPQGTATEGS